MSWLDNILKKNGRRRRTRAERETVLMATVAARRGGRTPWQWLGGIAIVLAAVGALAWVAALGAQRMSRALFSSNPLFEIRKLDLSSDGILTARIIREDAMLEERRNLFAVDLDRVRSALKSRPRVKDVQVTRILPDTLRVRLIERVPVAQIESAGTLRMLVDREGWVIGMNTTNSRMTLIRGIPIQGVRPGTRIVSGSFLSALRVVDVCDTTSMGQVLDIRYIDAAHADRMELILASGSQATLPVVNIENALQRLRKTVLDLRQKGQLRKRIDVTAEHNVAVEEL